MLKYDIVEILNVTKYTRALIKKKMDFDKLLNGSFGYV